MGWGRIGWGGVGLVGWDATGGMWWCGLGWVEQAVSDWGLEWLGVMDSHLGVVAIPNRRRKALHHWRVVLIRDGLD